MFRIESPNTEVKQCTHSHRTIDVPVDPAAADTPRARLVSTAVQRPHRRREPLVLRLHRLVQHLPRVLRRGLLLRRGNVAHRARRDERLAKRAVVAVRCVVGRARKLPHELLESRPRSRQEVLELLDLGAVLTVHLCPSRNKYNEAEITKKKKVIMNS